MEQPKTYTISLEGMDFHAFHGCYELEQLTGSHFCVDLKIEVIDRGLSKTDILEDGVSYLDVYQNIKKVMEVKQRTIEKVADNICSSLLECFDDIQHVECKVSKIAPPLGGKINQVSVILEKHR